MDLSSYEMKDLDYMNAERGGKINFGNDDCSYLEILSFAQIPGSVQHEGRLADAQLCNWVSKYSSGPRASAIPASSQPVPLNGLRLLYGECQVDNVNGLVLPLQKKSFHFIEEQFGLPSQFLKVMEGRGTRAFKRTSIDQEGKPHICFVFKCGTYLPSFYQLALSFNAETGITHGLLISKNKHHEFGRLTSTLKERVDCCTNPLLLAVLVTELVVDSAGLRTQSSNVKLNHLEQSMGQHEYHNLKLGDPLKVDFMSTTRRLNFIGKTLGIECLRLSSMLLVLERISEYAAKHLESTVLGEGDGGNSLRQSRRLESNEEMIEYLVTACRANLLRADYDTKRTQALIQVVYQFMSHKNANVNIKLAADTSTLARESKKDSATMKTIAILGMCFLPGTFLATIFAMPVFNWDDNDAPVLKAGFKYYWAVAIPLTFLVLVLWALVIVLPWRSWLLRAEVQSDQSELEVGSTNSIS